MQLIVEGTEAKEQPAMIKKLTGPFRTMGSGYDPNEIAAPAWWHGDEEAYDSSMAAMMTLPQRGRGRA